VNLAGFVLLLLTAFFAALANLSIKIGVSRTVVSEPIMRALLQLIWQPAFVVGMLLMGIAGLMWFRVLATQRLSTCYPLFVSLTYFLITIASFYFLHEQISAQKFAGLITIIVGITIVARG
jgi:multidrug transporter EmrE-like cation transporter